MLAYEFFDADMENQAESKHQKIIPLKIFHLILLFAIVFSPILIVILFYWLLNEAILTIFCFHFISLVTFPLLFINFILITYQTPGIIYDIRYFFVGKFKKTTAQCLYGFLFMIAILIIGFMAFYFMLKIVNFFFNKLKYDFNP